MKKKLLVMLVCIFLGFNTISQERINRGKLEFSSESMVLNKSVGWSYNNTIGEWVDYGNLICSDKTYKSSGKEYQVRYNLAGSNLMSRIYQNFNSLQIKSLTYNNTKYYVLIVDKWDGSYNYPTLNEDWHYFRKTCGYIFNESEYNKLKDIKSDTLTTINTTHFVEDINIYKESKFLDLIEYELSDSLECDSYSFILTKTRNVIRFIIPIKSGDFESFQYKYFETSLDNFNKLLIIKVKN
jgi:hypothetical protein